MDIPRPNSPVYTRASVATMVTFFFSGFVLASFLSRLPTIRDVFELSPASIGHILLIGSLGSLVALPASGPVAGRIGPRITVWSGFVAWALGMSTIVVTFDQYSPLLLAVGLCIAQIGSSLTNATMNIEGGYVEVLSRKAIMPWYHAAFSIGTVAAAGLGALMISNDVSVPAHLIFVIILTLVSILIAGLFYVPQSIVEQISYDSDSGAAKRTKRAWGEKRTIMIGFMVLGTGLMEGAANDWLALAMVDGFHFSPAAGTATFAFFLAVLTTARLLTPRMQRRWDAAPMLRVFLVIAIVGLLVLALSPWAWVALVGVVAWGIGASLGFPTGASAVSRDPKMTAARMSVLSTVGYGAFLVGPPAIGYIADFIGYKSALGFLIIPVLLSLYLTRYLDEK